MSNPVVSIIFDAKNMASGQIRQLKADIAGVGQQTGLSGAQMAALGVGVGAVAGVAVEAGKALLDYGSDAVRSAIEEQAATEKMTSALRANVAGWDGSTEAIGRRIDAGVKLSFSDDAMRASFTTLVTATKDVEKAFADQRIAMDLARLKGISLEDASSALVRVEGGQYRALKALGIVLRDGATQTDALAAVQKAAAGQAQAYADTITGRTEQIGERLDQLQQRIGGAAIPTIDRLTKGFIDLAEATDGGTDAQYRFERGVIQIDAAISGLLGKDDAQYFRNAAAAIDEVDRAAAGAQADLDKSRAAFAQWKRDATYGAAAVEGSLRPMVYQIHRVGSVSYTAAQRLGFFGDALDAVAGQASDDTFSVEELASKFQLAKDTLADDIAHLHELEKIKNPTRAQREDLEQTRLKVIDGKRELVDLNAKMLAAGKASFATTKKNIEGLGVALYNADGTATDLLKNLRLISGQSGNAGNSGNKAHGGGPTPTASGGRRAAGQLLLVGEQGPELWRPDSAGYMVPSGQFGAAPPGPAAGGGPLIGQIVFQTALPPSRAQVAELVDLIDGELRQRFAQHSPYASRY